MIKMRKQALLLLSVSALICISVLTPAYAQKNKAILALAAQYSTAMNKFLGQKGRHSLEPAIQKGRMVTGKLAELESLNQAEYNEEIVFIDPDVDFFVRLSKKSGTAADIAFFALLKKLKPDSVWAAYLEPETDYSGCTIYGNGLLTGLYKKAVQFKKVYPFSYSAYIKDEMEQILDRFNDDPYTCSDRAGVLREYRLFIRTFPDDKNTPAVKKALKVVEKKKELGGRHRLRARY
jgi:hypothetical protein